MNNLNCHSCPVAHRKIRGCQGFNQPKNLLGVKVDRCPVKVVPGYVFEYITAYTFYKNKMLPNDGGYMEQPVKFIESMLILEKAVTNVRTKP